ncbi:MAG: hypothetical protein NZM00_03500 [Anaerolinea sp.]|nr:hypothetical protein [Anaerolinea sp.]
MRKGFLEVTDWDYLETLVRSLLELYEITAPPIPLEKMLQTSRSGLWESVDLSEVSTGFFSPMNTASPYAPRVSLARMIGRKVLQSDWGKQQGLPARIQNDSDINTLARILMMPRHMIEALPPANRTPDVLSEYFEVPQSDVELRLADLAHYSSG